MASSQAKDRRSIPMNIYQRRRSVASIWTRVVPRGHLPLTSGEVIACLLKMARHSRPAAALKTLWP
jgi:hypothetical protein